MDIKTAVKIVEQMENDVESLCKCCMPKGAHCIGCRETAITTVLNELKKKDEVIEKAINIIAKEFLCYDNESDEYIQGLKIIKILKEVE